MWRQVICHLHLLLCSNRQCRACRGHLFSFVSSLCRCDTHPIAAADTGREGGKVELGETEERPGSKGAKDWILTSNFQMASFNQTDGQTDGVLATLAQCSSLSWSEKVTWGAAAATAAWQAAGWLLSEPLQCLTLTTPPSPFRFTRSVVLCSEPPHPIGCGAAAPDWPTSTLTGWGVATVQRGGAELGGGTCYARCPPLVPCNVCSSTHAIPRRAWLHPLIALLLLF